MAAAISWLKLASTSLIAATDASADLSLARLAQIGVLHANGLSRVIQYAPAGPQLDELLRIGFETEHFHLHLMHGLLASFPRVGDHSVGLKQN